MMSFLSFSSTVSGIFFSFIVRVKLSVYLNFILEFVDFIFVNFVTFFQKFFKIVVFCEKCRVILTQRLQHKKPNMRTTQLTCDCEIVGLWDCEIVSYFKLLCKCCVVFLFTFYCLQLLCEFTDCHNMSSVLTSETLQFFAKSFFLLTQFRVSNTKCLVISR